MFWKKWSQKPWYPFAAAGCIIVLVLVILLNLGSIFRSLRVFFGFFKPVFIAVVMAFVMNQLSMLYQRTVFSRITKYKYRNLCGIALAVISVIAFIIFALATLIPQIIDSISTLVGNLPTYEAAIQNFIEKWSIFDNFRGSDFYQNYINHGSLTALIGNYISENINHVLSAATATGKSIVMWVISFIISIYMLAEKQRLKKGFMRLLRAVLIKNRFHNAIDFLRRCDKILTIYIIYNLLDCLIVGLINAAFMTVTRLPYAGLISFVVAITNLAPTFGPIVGGALGCLLLLLVKPLYALIFLIFTILLQTVDGYIIKPKLFGNSLGVSGLWILIAIIALGRAFGIRGIIISIPVAAILDFIYHDYFMPWMESMRRKKEASIAASRSSGGSGDPPSECTDPSDTENTEP